METETEVGVIHFVAEGRNTLSLEAGKLEKDYLVEPPEGIWYCQQPYIRISDFQTCNKVSFSWFQSTKFMLPYFSSNRNLKQWEIKCFRTSGAKRIFWLDFCDSTERHVQSKS